MSGSVIEDVQRQIYISEFICILVTITTPSNDLCGFIFGPN